MKVIDGIMKFNLYDITKHQWEESNTVWSHGDTINEWRSYYTSILKLVQKFNYINSVTFKCYYCYNNQDDISFDALIDIVKTYEKNSMIKRHCISCNIDLEFHIYDILYRCCIVFDESPMEVFIAMKPIKSKSIAYNMTKIRRSGGFCNIYNDTIIFNADERLSRRAGGELWYHTITVK